MYIGSAAYQCHGRWLQKLIVLITLFQCLSLDDMLEIFDIDHSVGADECAFKELCPALVQQATSGVCKASDHEDHHDVEEKHLHIKKGGFWLSLPLRHSFGSSQRASAGEACFGCDSFSPIISMHILSVFFKYISWY